jgi:hypothetical protein
MEGEKTTGAGQLILHYFEEFTDRMRLLIHYMSHVAYKVYLQWWKPRN